MEAKSALPNSIQSSSPNLSKLSDYRSRKELPTVKEEDFPVIESAKVPKQSPKHLSITFKLNLSKITHQRNDDSMIDSDRFRSKTQVSMQ